MPYSRMLAMNPDTVLTRREGVSAHDLDDDLVLYPPGSDQAFVLNATASRVWSLLDGQRPLYMIALMLSEEYGVDLQDALRDVLELAESLADAGLVLEGSYHAP